MTQKNKNIAFPYVNNAPGEGNAGEVACASGNADVAAALVEVGAHLRTCNGEGLLAVHAAAKTSVAAVEPSPATHAILAQLKAGETVYQTGELPKTLRVSKIDYEPPKTVCETTFA